MRTNTSPASGPPGARPTATRRWPARASPGCTNTAPEIQPFPTLRQLPLALSFETRAQSVKLLNRILADSQILHSHYKRHHWLMRGPTFYQ